MEMGYERRLDQGCGGTVSVTDIDGTGTKLAGMDTWY